MLKENSFIKGSRSMNILRWWVLVIGLIGITIIEKIMATDQHYQQASQQSTPKKVNYTPVRKYVLKNGLTLLVYEVHTTPQVSLQLWFNVGSKDEQTGERGLAHLLEHMVFKGTKKESALYLSESDINETTHKLSGSCNAFTSYDYTGYLFNMPSQHYVDMLPILAAIIGDCSFEDEMLNSEMKAVIQELKLKNDQYVSGLVEDLMAMIFTDHPYHYPIIGFKQDLWTVRGKNLHAFYKKHYIPNNATLVVVGDVNADRVYQEVEHYFGSLKPNDAYKKEKYFFTRDIASKSLTIYRDVQQPTFLNAYVIPGFYTKQDNILQLLEWVLAKGRGSRLYRILVEELQLVTSLDVGYWDLFDHGVFFIIFEPKEDVSAQQVETIINQELNKMVTEGISLAELERALKKAQSALYSLFEENEELAYNIGKSFLATGDENYIFKEFDIAKKQIKKEIESLIKQYLRSAVTHKGAVLPIPDSEKKEWLQLQDASDYEDEQILSARQREMNVEEPVYTKTIKVKPAVHFNYPKAIQKTVSNGLTLFYHVNNLIPKISIVLTLRANTYYDPITLPGLHNFMSHMLTEGSKNYSAVQLTDVLESKGMSISSFPGGIALSLLKDDLEFALSILQELVTSAIFPPEEIEKVRQQLLAEVKNYWDDPNSFSSQLTKEKIYQQHPYGKNPLGTLESIAAISQKDLADCYKKYVSPVGAKIAIVGDISDYNIEQLVEKYLGSWQKVSVEELTYPPLAATEQKEQNYYINRDQVVLTIARLSVARTHPDFDKLLLFDQIFGGGVLGSLSSRLFALREQSGLFYTISGSFVNNAYEQPGLLSVRTIVSLDRLKEAEAAIKNTILTAVNDLTTEELEQAKRAIINASVDNFSSNMATARTFLHLDRFHLPADFFDTRAERFAKITVADVQQAVKKVLSDGSFFTLRVGRLS